MSNPRHHHYVPKAYLRDFAKGKQLKANLLCIDSTSGKTYRTNVRNVAGERDFNRVDVDGMDPNLLEKGLSGFEGEASQAIHRICERGSFTNPADRNQTFNLIALLERIERYVNQRIPNSAEL